MNIINEDNQMADRKFTLALIRGERTKKSEMIILKLNSYSVERIKHEIDVFASTVIINTISYIIFITKPSVNDC